MFRSASLKASRTTALIYNMSLPMRRLKLHEYQAAKQLRQSGVEVPLGAVAFDPREAYILSKRFGDRMPGYVVKAQVLTGGRGLGYFKENNFKGGVHMVKTPDAVQEYADKMLGKTLITKQTGEKGLMCGSVYIVERLSIDREIYFAIALDRKAGGPVLICSTKGGMNIEDVAHRDPSAIIKIPIEILEGIKDSHIDQAIKALGLEKIDKSREMIKNLYNFFISKDCDLVEINPMIVTKDQRLLAADAKITVDQNAEFRQTNLKDQEDRSQLNYKERIAETHNLNYIYIGGNIGCLVNGAGLAMATMDIIKYYGGNPANFLDIGGGAEGEQIVEALKLLNGDPEVESILVNIFGGILRCDVLAQSIIKASTMQKFDKPIVLRLKGTNAAIAKKMIEGKEQELNLHYTDDLDFAARKAVDLSLRSHNK